MARGADGAASGNLEGVGAGVAATPKSAEHAASAQDPTVAIIKTAYNKEHRRGRRIFYALSAFLLLVALITSGIGLIPLAIAGWLSFAALAVAAGNYIYNSVDRAQTAGKGVAFAITAATVALLFEKIHDCNLFDDLPALLIPFAVMGAAGSFIANIILYRQDVPDLIGKFLHHIDTLQKQSWLHHVINFLIFIAACITGYLFTSGMWGAWTLIFAKTIFLGVSIGTAPYIVVPLMIVAFIGNTAFVKSGLLKIKNMIVEAWKGEHLSCQENRGWKGLAYYFFNLTRQDTWNIIAKKIALGMIKLVVASGIAYLSQVPIVGGFISTATKMSGAIIPTVAKSLGTIISSVSVIAAVSRVAIITQKCHNVGKVLWARITERVQQKGETAATNTTCTFTDLRKSKMLNEDTIPAWKEKFVDTAWCEPYQACANAKWKEGNLFTWSLATVKAVIQRAKDSAWVGIAAVLFNGFANGALSYDGVAPVYSADTFSRLQAPLAGGCAMTASAGATGAAILKAQENDEKMYNGIWQNRTGIVSPPPAAPPGSPEKITRGSPPPAYTSS